MTAVAAATAPGSQCPTLSGPAARTRALPTAALRQLQQRCRALPLDADSLLLLAGSGGGGGGDGLLPLRAALYGMGYAALTGAAYASVAWPDRPRGWSRQDLLEVRSSPVEGRGVFARIGIPAGTVLGAYPGYLRTGQQMTEKCAGPGGGARYYCFLNERGFFLDPTDLTGAPSPRPRPGLPWPDVDVTLSYVNEPPPGVGGTNAAVEDDPSDAQGLLFVASRPISAGQEVFIDYGQAYDRSTYGQ